MASRQCILAMELEDIEKEKFDGSLAKRQIRQYFPPSINCSIQCVCVCAHVHMCVMYKQVHMYVYVCAYTFAHMHYLHRCTY